MPESRAGKRGGKKRRSTMAESGQTKKRGAEVIVGYGKDDKEKLIKWTSFEEVEKIVGPYVRVVIDKTLKSGLKGGYKNAKQVYADYRIFYVLRTKLINGQDELRVAMYLAEYFIQRARREKALMLSTISSSDALEDRHQEWLSEKLKEDNPEELLESANHAIARLDDRMNKMDKNVKNEITKQMENKLSSLSDIAVRFQAGDLHIKMDLFEDLKLKLLSEKELVDLLVKRTNTYYEALDDVEGLTVLRLQLEFNRLLRDDETDLSSKWVETTRGVNELVKQEEERMQKARSRSLYIPRK